MTWPTTLRNPGMTEPNPDEVLVEDRGPVRIITLNRPAERNPASIALQLHLARLAREVAADESIRAVIITAAGRTFSAGGDFDHFIATAGNAEKARESSESGRALITAMLDVPVPVIAAVNGAAAGFGAGLVALCDIVIMAETAFLLEPHAKLGMVVGNAISVTWPFLTSLNKARELAFTGDRLSAADAVACGLANKAVPLASLMDEALAMAERIARQPRSALAGSKQLFNLYARAMVDTVLDAQIALQVAQVTGPDHMRIVEAMAQARENG